MKSLHNKLPGKFSTNDGSIDFYLRIRNLIDKKKIVLDLGAGRGDWYLDNNNRIAKQIQFLKNDVKKFYAADVDSLVLKNKASSKNLIIKNGKIPLKDKSIDIIICDWVLEHVENPDLFYKEVNRILKKGGTFCARTPHKFNYASIISNFLEGWKLKDWLLNKSQPGRKKYFKSFYKMNTITKINRIFFNFKSNNFIAIPDPAYTFNIKIIYNIFKFIHFVTPRFFSGIIIIFLKKNY